MKHRIGALFLSLCLLFPLTACQSDEPVTDTASVSETDPIETETEFNEEILYEDLPTGDFGGDVFNMLQYQEHTVIGVTVHSEEQTGEMVNDAMYDRSATVEERLNIDIELYATSLNEVNSIISNSVSAGDDSYDVFWQHMQNMAMKNVLSGYVFNLSDVDGLDFEKPWWDNNLMTYIGIGDDRYMACGDISLYLWEYQTALVFNKDIMQDFGLTYPYEMVDKGTWTIDAFLQTVADVKADLNGNGVFGDVEEDLFALGGYPSMSFNGFFYGAEKKLFQKDGDNLPVYLGVSEDFYDFFAKLATVVSDTTLTCYRDAYITNFAEGRLLFYAGSIGNLNAFREIESDYGLVPYPKLDETQSSYQSFVTGQMQPLAIPISSQTPDQTGVILENLAAESYRLVREPYFETLQQHKYVRDEDSIRMLEIIYSVPTHTYIEYVYNWEGVVGKLDSHLRSEPDTLISDMKSIEKAINTAVQNTIDALNG